MERRQVNIGVLFSGTITEPGAVIEVDWSRYEQIVLSKFEGELKVPKVKLEMQEGQCQDIRLKNGDLIVACFSGMGAEVSTEFYLISTFGNECVDKDWNLAKRSSEYCALVNLSTGLRAFPEPCSRRTTMARIMNHFRGPAHRQLRKINIISNNNYSIVITTDSLS